MPMAAADVGQATVHGDQSVVSRLTNVPDLRDLMKKYIFTIADG
jgi:hypothetical protein